MCNSLKFFPFGGDFYEPFIRKPKRTASGLAAVHPGFDSVLSSRKFYVR